MSFFPVDREILSSSIWAQGTPEQLKVWFYLMVSANPANGIVADSDPGIAMRCGFSVEDTVAILGWLASPDPHSRTKDYDGRRIERLPGGGVRLLNYTLHRDRDYSTPRVQKYRQRAKETTLRTVSPLQKREEREVTGAETTDTDTDTDTDEQNPHPNPPQGGNGSVSVKTLHRRKRKAAAGIETLDVLGNREWIDAYNELLNAKLEYGTGNLQAVQRARDHGYTIDQAKQTFRALAEQSTPLAKWCVEHRKWDLEFLIRPPHSRQGNWTLGIIDKIHNELASGMVNE